LDCHCRDVIEHVTGKKYPVAKYKDYEAMYEEGVFSLCPIVIKKAVKIADHLDPPGQAASERTGKRRIPEPREHLAWQ